jgi:8-oxo-dGTP pyrophosphatase MutT (NUDIX family)
VHRLQFDLPDGSGSLTDFASGTLNTAARLCDLARPEGIVILQEAFPDWSPQRAGVFDLVEVPVKSIGPVPVWVSRPILTRGSPREMRRVVVEFHVGTVCFEPHTRQVLLAHRRNDRELYPGLWETGGGQLYPGESIAEAAIRIAKAEFGVDVEVAWNASVVPFEINTESRYIPGMKVLCLFNYTEFAGFRNERQHLETRAIAFDDLRDSERWPDSGLIPGTKVVVNTLIGHYLAGGDNRSG